MTIQIFASSSDAVGGWGKGRAQYFLQTHLTPGTPGSNENPPPCEAVREKRRSSTEGSGKLGKRAYHRKIAYVEVPYIVKIMWALQCGIFSKVLLFAQAQIARQNAILFTKSARLYTKFKASLSTDPHKYPKKYPRG